MEIWHKRFDGTATRQGDPELGMPGRPRLP